MDADRTCLVAPSGLSFMMRGSNRELVEPIRFRREMADNLSKQLKYPSNFEDPKSYREPCEKIEKVVLEQKKDSDEWKDCFFFLMLYEPNLCDCCKEGMKKSFYEGDRNTAMNWLPAEEQCCGGRKYYKAVCY
jgi:hypothetical protein